MTYLDYAATTPCLPEVVDAMLPFLTTEFGNAASIDHLMGTRARTAVEQARSYVGQLVGAPPEDVIFTSGATESNNIALNSSRQVVTSSIEHPSVLDFLDRVRKAESTILKVDAHGEISASSLVDCLSQRKVAQHLVSIMLVNNEVGTTQDVQSLSAAAHQLEALFHTDATQAVVTTSIEMRQMQIDALSISAHKLYGPKGVGALICNAAFRRELLPRQFGGGHERGIRSGTLNVPGIVGFGEAAKIALQDRPKRVGHLSKIRRLFIENLTKTFGGSLTIHGTCVSPHIASVRLAKINNRALLRANARQLCFSLGSACATAKSEPSHVLIAMGLSDEQANETVRISFGAQTTEKEVELAATALGLSANRLLELVA